MTTIAPKKITLTCTVTGKVTVWTNQKIIQSKIDEFGSLEAFMAQYKCRGAGKSETIADKIQKPKMMKTIMEQGVKLGKMSADEYRTEYVTRRYDCGDGTFCTVTAPKPPQSKFEQVNDTLHAASKATAAVTKGKTWHGVAV